MELLPIEVIIAHCDRQLARTPKETIFYREHESVRAYLRMLQRGLAVNETKDLISRSALLKKAQPLLTFDMAEVVWVKDDVLLAPEVDIFDE